MAEYVAFSPQAQVAGRVILSTFDAIGPDSAPFLTKHHLIELNPDRLYSQQTFLDALREIATRKAGDFLDMVAVGMRVAERSVFPPTVDGVEAALLALDVAYQKNNPGPEQSQSGRYHIQKVGERQIDVIAENPFPCDMVYGVLYGTVRRFKAAGPVYYIYHDNGQPCRKNGALTCTYHIVWKRHEEDVLQKRWENNPQAETGATMTQQSREPETTPTVVNSPTPDLIK